MKEAAKGLAQFGRYGDNNLVHVSNKELRGLEQLTGRKFTQNPHTGLPEAFGWTDLIPIAAGVAGTVVGGPLGGAAASGLTRAAVTTAEGGSAEKALTQGLISGVTSYAGGQLMAGVGEAASAGTQGATAAAQAAPGTGGAVITEPLGAVGANTASAGAQGAAMTIPAQAGAGLPSVPISPESAAPPPTFADKLATSGARAESVFSEPGKAFGQIAQNVKASPGTAAMFLGGSALQAQDMLYGQPKIPGEIPYDPSKYPEQFPANPRRWNAPPSTYQPGYSAEYRYFAKGGLTSFRPEGSMTENLLNEATAALLGEHPKPREAIERFRQVAGDGALRSLQDRITGGRVKGAGGGLDDLVPGDIEGRQRVRLADGEFVIPSDVVSGLGDGSTDQGVRKLHEMMNQVRMKRTGKKAQPKSVGGEIVI